jgi:predicted transposase/invertase (TIGR01784 family)
MQEVNKLDPELASKIMELPISYEEKGKEIGRNEATRRIAQNMIKDGFPLNTIAKITELPVEEIKRIMEKGNE